MVCMAVPPPVLPLRLRDERLRMNPCLTAHVRRMQNANELTPGRAILSNFALEVQPHDGKRSYEPDFHFADVDDCARLPLWNLSYQRYRSAEEAV